MAARIPFSNTQHPNDPSSDGTLGLRKEAYKTWVASTVRSACEKLAYVNGQDQKQMLQPVLDGSWNDIETLNAKFNFNPGGFPGGPPDDDDPPIDPKIFNLSYVGGLDEQVKYIRRNVVLPWLMTDQKVIGGLGDLIEPAKGIIFYGPPGTGKTLMGKCIAGELQKITGKKISFIMRRGTDVFSKWVGESERKLRDVFAKAEMKKPSVIFFDEIDGLVPARREGQHEHTVSVVTTFLGMMDKVNRGEVFVIGATNRLDALDPAALRPGRFDKHIRFTPPNEAGRVHILNVNLNKWKRKKPSAQEIAQIAARTVGYTGADLEQLIRNTVNCAIEREFPDLGSDFGDVSKEIEKLKNIQVIMSDWMKALASMSNTNANVFGSTIYCGVPLTESMVPLVGGIVQDLKARCEELLDLCNCNSSSTGIKSLLVFGNTESELRTVETLLIPGLIGSFDSVQVKGFIACDSGKDIFTALAKANSGALEKPSVIFIPRIDKVWTFLIQHGMQHSFLKQIEDTRKTNLIILSTAMCDRDVFPLELRGMFQGHERSMQSRKPTQQEIRAFLSPIFNLKSHVHQNFTKAGKKELKCSEKHLNPILDKAVIAASGEEIQSVLALHQELVLVFSRAYNGNQKENQLVKSLNDTISIFVRTKFLTK